MKLIDDALLRELTAKAAASPRQRAHHNLHPRLDDPVQRLCIAIEPGTYIRPHRHADPPTWEIFLLLRGAAVVLFFDDIGRVVARMEVAASGPVRGLEIPPDTWHTITSIEPETVFFEVKKGPYVQPKDNNIAAWAPAEGAPDVMKFLEWYKDAKTGDIPPKC